ncbi:hypothetical protein GW17_00022465 [Ensete ventricosum]|nr:hypothetical protein GW17_00022465 [Ensete ventricosum]
MPLPKVRKPSLYLLPLWIPWQTSIPLHQGCPLLLRWPTAWSQPGCPFEAPLGAADQGPMVVGGGWVGHYLLAGRLAEARRAIEAQASELTLELALAHRCFEEAKVRLEEARDELAITEDEAMYNLSEVEGQLEVLCRELKLLVVAYKFGYQFATGHFKASYHKLEVDEDPYMELPSYKVSILRRFPLMTTQ